MIWGYLKEPFSKYGLAIPIKLGIASYPHALITGASGSGKTQALLFLLGKLLQNIPDIVVYLCDFKNSEDFSFLKGYTHYYTGKDCYQGIMEYYQCFSDTRENGSIKNRSILICDEYPAFVNYLQMQDKQNKTKYATIVLNSVAEILMLGRGINFGIWIVTQRADSTLFSNGARDNFMVIVGLGNLSKEQKGMVFSGQEIPDTRFSAGEGMLLADSKEIMEVKYPMIANVNDWKSHILRILQKQSGG
ncbi:hypothetical protein [Roseburia sp. 499]|uniref:hypothetical protein n=1 Tax=Roseburia sp. 499 TaxID=1261634 RepID=UPI0009530219|nr:hypothetical protein [Roseburia sp. 499]WVK69226.1 hypothetical protein BIV20_12725 [Roseburia sp. 499]